MKIVEFRYVDDAEQESRLLPANQSSPVCHKCGSAISYRFRAEDGHWYGSECIHGDEKTARSLSRLAKEVMPLVGHKAEATFGRTTGTVAGVKLSKSGKPVVVVELDDKTIKLFERKHLIIKKTA